MRPKGKFSKQTRAIDEIQQIRAGVRAESFGMSTTTPDR